MSHQSRASSEVETPVNPYSLLDAVNRSSDTARAGWIIFLCIMTYVMITVAGVTSKGLPLATPVALPILQVEIPIAHICLAAPIVLVLLHLGLVSRLVLLARQTMEFDRAVRLLEVSDKRTHPLRLELNNFFFVQVIAGPQRSAVLGAVLHGLDWLTLAILPLALILYIQVTFLPYHDTGVTWTHRIALLSDILMLIILGVFLMRAETSFFRAFANVASEYPVSVSSTALVLIVLVGFSCFAVTVPGEALDGFLPNKRGANSAEGGVARGP